MLVAVLAPILFASASTRAGSAETGEVRATAVAAGGWVILRNDGSVISFRDANNLDQPVLVEGLHDIIAISGANPGWALRKDGRVFSWEYRCTVAEQPICDIAPAVEIAGVQDAISISKVASYGLILLRDGSVWGLGEDLDGQITGRHSPNPSEHKTFKSPIKLLLPEPIASISAGQFHSVAIDRKGQVWSWGGVNHRSVLGVGESTQAADGSSLTRISNMPPAVAVWAGVQTYVSDINGGIWSWGEINLSTKSGRARFGTQNPSLVSGLKDISKASISTFYDAFLDTKGRISIIGVAPGSTIYAASDQRNGTYVREPTQIEGFGRMLDVSGGLDGLTVIDAAGEVLRFSASSRNGPAYQRINIEIRKH
ncbi:hypothetical protein [Bradyrhizobium sp. CCBAU 53421]|uniref:hypothetical protein n=1 Tax=Bradyrhizobium sp. CCBAU 53421 TaxID=1325120 RepID=UPI001AEDD3A5|nr:hypothetical protein [Bradyrhizobium sp. CCBAU 53421]